jgi:hypothetical protein
MFCRHDEPSLISYPHSWTWGSPSLDMAHAYGTIARLEVIVAHGYNGLQGSLKMTQIVLDPEAS